MVTLARNWAGAGPNQVPASNASLQAQGSSFLRALKDLILGSGATVIGSSDGTTAGLDAVDRWTADNKLVWAAGGVAHSWFWMQLVDPVASFHVYVGICLSTGAANQHLATIQVTTSAPTAGSITADPTTVGAKTRTWTSMQYIRTPVANAHSHQMRSDGGDVLYYTSTDSSGFPAFAFGYNRLVNGEPGVNYPCVAWCNWQDTGTGGFQILSGSQIAAFDQSGNLFTANGDLIYLRANNANAALADMFDGQTGTIVDPTRLPLGPIGVAIKSGSLAGFLGVVVDVFWAPNGPNTTQGLQEPKSPATPTTAKFGLSMSPCLGVTPSF